MTNQNESFFAKAGLELANIIVADQRGCEFCQETMKREPVPAVLERYYDLYEPPQPICIECSATVGGGKGTEYIDNRKAFEKAWSMLVAAHGEDEAFAVFRAPKIAAREAYERARGTRKP